MDTRNEIREFLTSRRARITPEQSGLQWYGENRRVPGLRREEVALLAGVTVDYYTRLERGNLSGVSETATLLLVANAATMAGAFRAEEDGEIDPAVAAALNDISSLIIGIAAPVALAVFVAAMGIVSIATGVLPRSLGRLSLLLALGFLIPYISFVFCVPFAVGTRGQRAPVSPAAQGGAPHNDRHWVAECRSPA